MFWKCDESEKDFKVKRIKNCYLQPRIFAWKAQLMVFCCKIDSKEEILNLYPLRWKSNTPRKETFWLFMTLIFIFFFKTLKLDFIVKASKASIRKLKYHSPTRSNRFPLESCLVRLKPFKGAIQIDFFQIPSYHVCKTKVLICSEKT